MGMNVELGMKGGACVHQAHPKYSHKWISGAARSKFSGITASCTRRGWRQTSVDAYWLTR